MVAELTLMVVLCVVGRQLRGILDAAPLIQQIPLGAHAGLGELPDRNPLMLIA